MKPPKKRTIYTLLLISFLFLPGAKWSAREYELALAKTLYAMAGSESYETMVALGSAAMNRVRSDEYPDTLTAVLNEGEFYRGNGYDERALSAAAEVLAGRRTLPESTLRFERAAEGESAGGGFFIGSFHFY